jgi:hypothetical protein
MQLQRTVRGRPVRGASAPFHHALAPRWTALCAAAELRRSANTPYDGAPLYHGHLSSQGGTVIVTSLAGPLVGRLASILECGLSPRPPRGNTDRRRGFGPVLHAARQI